MTAARYTSRYRWAILGIAFMAQLSASLVGQAVGPLAPFLQSELGLNRLEVGLFSSALSAGSWAILLSAGTLTDRFGVGRTLSVGMMVSGVFTLAMSVVGSLVQAAMVMFAVGLGRGCIEPGVTKAIMDWFAQRARGTVMGLKQTAVPIGGLITASSLPALALLIGWRYALAVVGLYSLAGALAAARFYRDPEPSGSFPSRRVGMREGLSAVLRNGYLWVVSVVAVLLVTVQFGLTTYLALYFHEVVLIASVPDPSARMVAAGGFLALSHAGGVCGRLFWGILSDRAFHGRRMVVAAIIGFLMALASASTAFLGPASPTWLLMVVVFVYGGTAIGWAGVLQVLMVETTGRKYAATGVGLSMTISQFGTTGGPPLFGLIVDASQSYQVAWIFLAALSLIGATTAAVASRSEKHAE